MPASGVGAVSLNVTATNAEARRLRHGVPVRHAQLVSSVNFTAGATVANAVIAPVSADGDVCFYSLAADVDLIADINGWFPS